MMYGYYNKLQTPRDDDTREFRHKKETMYIQVGNYMCVICIYFWIAFYKHLVSILLFLLYLSVDYKFSNK